MILDGQVREKTAGLEQVENRLNLFPWMMTSWPKHSGRGVIAMHKKILPVLAFAGLLVAPRLFAHHSFAAEFSYEENGTIEGEVIEVLFVNPHARFFVAVINEAGEEEIWDTQTSSSVGLTRFGWVKDTLQVGDRVIMEGNLGRNNTRKLWIRQVTLEDGRVITPTPGGAASEKD